MVDYTNAINDLRFLETRFKNLMEVIPHLTELGSLENAMDEAKRQIEKLKSDIDALVENKKVAEDALTEAQKVLDNRKKDFDAWLEIETAKANNDAEAILATARVTAQRLIDNAKDKADQTNFAVKASEATLEDLQAKITLATDQHDKIQKKLQSIKDSL